MPCSARRTLAKVNCSAMTARHPEVPNLISVGVNLKSHLARVEATFCLRLNLRKMLNSAFARRFPSAEILNDRQEDRPHHRRQQRRGAADRVGVGGAQAGGLRQHCLAGGIYLSVER